MALNRLVNTVRLLGTIIKPFEKVARGKYTVFMTKIEVKSNDTSIQNIPLTFYAKQKNQIFNYSKDLTGKQVIIEGYVQGNEFTKKSDGKTIDYIYIVVRDISVLSDRDSDTATANGIIVSEEDLPF